MQSSRIIGMLILASALTGCYADPFRNPDNWSMTGAAAKNTAAQVANPSDLISGQSEPYSNGVAAAAGVDKALGGAAGTAAGLLTPPPAATLNITGS